MSDDNSRLDPIFVSDSPSEQNHSQPDDFWSESGIRPQMSRRTFLASAAGAAVVASARPLAAAPWVDAGAAVNLAVVAKPSSVYISGDTKLSALNDGGVPANSRDRRTGSFGTWPRTDTMWVQYDWAKPVTTNKVDVYWWIDGRDVAAPASYRVLYWNGSAFVPVSNAQGLGVDADKFNTTTFDAITSDKLRIELVSDGKHSPGILEWKVYSSGPVPALPPVVDAGVDRVVVLGGPTYLSGSAVWLQEDPAKVQWTKQSGPGRVTFANAASAETTATFDTPGEYVLKLTAGEGSEQAVASLTCQAQEGPPRERLDVVYTTRYAIDSPFWKARAKAIIVSWIPHCIEYCERTDLKTGQGGIDNFIEAAKALRGEPHGRHLGYVFSNAWVHQTVESMCIALMVDPQGDPEIIAAQEKMRATLENWIPIVLAAQEPDGYLQTAFTLADRQRWPERWSPRQRGNHEGYVAGYFIESAINHHTLTEGKDLRLYNGAKKLADCWVANIGPGKKEWFDGHQEMEQALVRFGRFVNDVEGNGRGNAYIQLAKFLLDSRKGGSEYDQSHLPPARQYEAVGHAVRAVYFYSGMADIAAETGDRDYQSAVASLWDNMVNKKYYVTGGVGSGETSEGFGPNYSLRNEAYCETCSSCGLVFFQYKLNLAYHDAKYADLYEETIYNAILGNVDLDGTVYAYTNPLINTLRTRWHSVPCCVANFPRTLLMMPTWTYVKSRDAVYVNLFAGSRINVGKVAGTDVQMVQKTNYPWNGAVEITVNPKETKTFSVYVRIPNRTTSKLYTPTPAVSGYKQFAVNGKAVKPKIERGYAVITRQWKAGDRINVEFPMEPQRLTADQRIMADKGQTALRYGPLVYNVELADQPDLGKAAGAAPVKAEWREDLLAGVMTLKGEWQDGSPMLAIPNYARMNRLNRPPMEFPGPDPATSVPVATPPGAEPAPPERQPRRRIIQSQVWMKDKA